MSTVDELLKNIVDNNIHDSFTMMSSKDKRVLFSLNKQIKSGYFLTQRQGNLLIKILNSYRSMLSSKNFFDISMLDNPLWSQVFRVIKPIKKILLNEKNNKIILEFTYDKELKNRVFSFVSDCYGSVDYINSSKIEIPKNEKNILEIFKHLKSCDFYIEQKIVDLHEKITKIIDQKENFLDILSPSNEKLLSKVHEEISPDDENYFLKLLDRRHRYQYNFSHKTPNDSLVYKVAARSVASVFINQDTHSLTGIFDSLIKLDRLPVLLIFNSGEVDQCQKYLDFLKNALDTNKISKTGIYFRLDNNTENNKKFNASIAEYGYNSMLDENTSVVGIANGTLPKFVLKSKWKARSVISFTNAFKSNKVAVYANDIDLTIFYNNHKPFTGEIDELV